MESLKKFFLSVYLTETKKKHFLHAVGYLVVLVRELHAVAYFW
jgi:hypothetical protein